MCSLVHAYTENVACVNIEHTRTTALPECTLLVIFGRLLEHVVIDDVGEEIYTIYIFLWGIFQVGSGNGD